MDIKIDIEEHVDGSSCIHPVTLKLDKETIDLKEFLNGAGYRHAGIMRKAIKWALREAKRQVIAKRTATARNDEQSVA